MTQSMSKEEARKALGDLYETHIRKVDDLLALINAPETRGLWKPKKGEPYCTLDSSGEAFEVATSYKASARAAHGLVFPSKAIARKVSPLLARSNKWIAAAFQADEDAGEWAGDRRWLVWSERGTLRISYSVWDAASPAFVHTAEQAEEMKRILIAEGLGK